MAKYIILLFTLSFYVYADDASDKLCRAVTQQAKCGEEKVSKCTWSQKKCKMNKALLEEGESLADSDDSCVAITSAKACTEEKVALCAW